jgi:hypothetical protein
VVSQVLYLT